MFALLPTALSLLAAAATPPTITPAEAAKYVGLEVVVRGKAEQVVTAVTQTVHVNFGGRFPDEVFTAKIVEASSQGAFMDVESYEGKLVAVRGVVRMYEGKPVIEVRLPTNLRLVEAAPPASSTPEAAVSKSDANGNSDPNSAGDPAEYYAEDPPEEEQSPSP